MSGFSLTARFPKASKAFLEANAGLVAPKPPTVADQRAQKSPLAVKFEQLWEVIGGPMFVTELPVVEDRRWRLDCAWPDEWVALELQGGIYLAGKGGTSLRSGSRTTATSSTARCAPAGGRASSPPVRSRRKTSSSSRT